MSRPAGPTEWPSLGRQLAREGTDKPAYGGLNRRGETKREPPAPAPASAAIQHANSTAAFTLKACHTGSRL
jgi:hypothetical protein